MAEVTSFSDESEELVWEEVEDSFDTWINDIDPDINEGPGAIGYSYEQMLKAFKAGYKLMKYGTTTWKDEDEATTSPGPIKTIESLKQLLKSINGFLSGSN